MYSFRQNARFLSLPRAFLYKKGTKSQARYAVKNDSQMLTDFLKWI